MPASSLRVHVKPHHHGDAVTDSVQRKAEGVLAGGTAGTTSERRQLLIIA